MRLKIPEAKGNRSVLEEIRSAVNSMVQVHRVEANALTGSVLVLYDAPDDLAFVRSLYGLGVETGLFDLPIPAPKDTVRLPRPGGMRVTAGRWLLAAGVAGVLLPIIPGTPFLIAGAALLGPGDPVVAKGAKLLRAVRRTTVRFF